LPKRQRTCAPYVRFGRWVRAGDYQWATPRPELEQVMTFCRSLAGDRSFALPPAVTLDVGRIEGKGWAVVQANPAWSSGLYDCDPAPVLQRASVRREVLNDADRSWSIRR
jgi:hypothetical protein